MKTDTKLDILRRLPVFAGASTNELRQIASQVDEIDVPAGYTLTREGDRGREFVVLVEGSATVENDGRVIATLGDGDFLGEIALLLYTQRTATVTTTTPSRLLVMTDRTFRTLVDDVPAFSRRVWSAAAART
jgi:CRP/FNR family transcriptional regulator, cyclic AMP receptor protein